MPRSPLSLRRCAALVALAAALSLGGPAAVAQEQLIMPYACSAAGGRVTLEPSREEAYRIYGQREERRYTVCSPVNPNVCRTWLLHRFEFDCAGVRVDWLSAVEAASEQTTGRAWVEDGRMRMRMNQYWGRGVGPDDPCPRWRRRGQNGDECERGFQRRQPVVEMPAGFAPAFGLPVRFAPLDLPALPADTHARADPSLPGRAAPTTRSARAEPPREVAAKDQLGKDQPAKDQPGKVPQVAGSTPGTPAGTPKPAGRPAATPGDTQAEAIAPAQAKPKRIEPVREAAAEPVVPSGNVSVIPKIINRPGASTGTEQSTTGQVSSSKPTSPAIKPSEPVLPTVGEAKSETKSEPKAVPKSVPEPTRRSEGADAAAGHSTLSAYAPSSTAQALVGFAGLVAAALALFAWTRRREQLSLAAAGAREFGTVTLGGRAPQGRTGTAVASARPVGVTPRPPPLPPGVPTTTSFPVADAPMPVTREQACQVLGTSPDAAEAAVKKIVEGLRQSWHPDLATSEPDRQLREQRTTQINVAWEILSGKRPAA